MLRQHLGEPSMAADGTPSTAVRRRDWYRTSASKDRDGFWAAGVTTNSTSAVARVTESGRLGLRVPPVHGARVVNVSVEHVAGLVERV